GIVGYDLASDLDLVFGTGSGCEGSARILLERVGPEERWPGRVAEALARRETGRFETLLEAPFAHRLCPPDETFGSDAPVFREELLPPLSLVVFGAGDDAVPLTALARAAGLIVSVVDRRAAFAVATRFPGARVACGPEGDFARAFPWDSRTAIVVMTHSYERDLEILANVLTSPAFYIGLLGPRRRSNRMLEGLPGADPARLHSPAGLDLGSESPAEIALAILAEIHAVHSGRRAVSLRDRAGTIHGGVTP
ncbi:MAG: XdhC family protein, partial [Acidobacteria bacterium]|nr:XdhC family protein [Acidobacteriota bacterium]